MGAAFEPLVQRPGDVMGAAFEPLVQRPGSVLKGVPRVSSKGESGARRSPPEPVGARIGLKDHVRLLRWGGVMRAMGTRPREGAACRWSRASAHERRAVPVVAREPRAAPWEEQGLEAADLRAILVEGVRSFVEAECAAGTHFDVEAARPR
jgi:hypothetical protein